MEDIIRLFNANETNFNHSETILTDVLSFESEVEENGISYCEMTCPLDDRIEEGKIIKAPTPIGEQLFRIIKINRNLPAMTLYVYGRHISYDLLNNMLLNIRPTATTQQNALNAILAGTEYPHPFTATSDAPGINTANYVRMNPIQAIMGADNSALTLWGGFLRRDNFLIKVLATSPDKGYEVRFGKNLLGVDEELDMTEVVTRLYPTVVIQEPTVTALPEKYVDSPLINSYPKPIIKEYRIALTDEEKLLTLAQIYTLMRTRCAEQWTLKADQPKVNYKVDFVELRKTEQYKHLAVLEELDISDTVWIYVSPLGLNMSSRMIKYRHDGLNDRYLSMELGNFKPKLTSQKAEFAKLVKDATKDLTDGVITAMLKDAVDRIQGNLGGNVVTITVDGKPVATAYMDTADVATANEYVILNNKGIAFGINGLNNPPELAIDINGSVVGSSAFFRSITTNLIQSELGKDLVLTSNTAITNLVSGITALDGRLDSAELKITPAAITQTVEANTTTLATKALVTQTSTDWTAKFSEIGSTNLVLDSATERRSSAYLVAEYSIGEDFIENQIYTMTLFRNAIQAGQTFALWQNGAGSSKGELIYKGNGIYRITFVSSAIQVGFERTFRIYQLPQATVGVMAIGWIKLEKGSVATDWSPAPSELYTGITKINKDGINVSVSSDTTNTQISSDGLRVYDGTTERAFFGQSGSYIPDLEVGTINGDVINTLPGDVTYNVGSTQTIKTISDALEDLGKKKNLNGFRVTINVYGNVSDFVKIDGFSNGNIDVAFQSGAKLYGQIVIRNCAANVYIAGTLSAKGTIRIPTTGEVACIYAANTSSVRVDYMILDGANNPDGRGIQLQSGTSAFVSNIDSGRVRYGFVVATSSRLVSTDNRGTCSGAAFYISDGVVFVRGTIPVGGRSAGHYYEYGAITEVASSFAPPAVTPITFSKLFKPVKLQTFIRGTSTAAGTYGSTAAQGKASAGTIWTEGRIIFGTDVAQYWQGGTSISVRMRLRRQNSTHGLSAACKPDPDNFLAGGVSLWPTAGAIRGGWTDWATISSAEFSTTANKEFRLYSPALDSGYAIWDAAEVEVTVTKNV